ncbi:MAG: hypothetical protein DCC75_07470, partial [Proteobacteria bacterium]
ARLFKGVLGAIHSEGGIEAAFSVIGLFCPGLPYKPRRQLRTPDAPVRDTPIKVVSAPEPTQPPAIRSEPRSPPASLEPGPEHRLRDSAVASIAPAHLAPQTVAPSPAPSTSVSPPARAPGARPDVHSRPSRRGCRLQFEDSLDRIEHQLGYTFRNEALALTALGIVELPVVDSTSRSWLDALGGYALQFAAARIIAPKMSLEAPWREIAAHVAQVTGPESLHALSRDLGLAEHIVFEGLTQSLVQMERSIVSRTRALLGALFLDATDEEFEIVVSRRISSTFDGMALDSEGLAKLLEQPVDLNAAEQTDFEAALGHTFIEPRLLRAAFNCIPKLEGAAGSSNLEYIGRAALRLSAIDTLRKRGVTSEDDRGIEAKRLSGAEHLFETERGRLLQYVMVQNGRIKPVMQKQLLLSAVGAVCLDVGYAKTSELLRSLLQPAPAGTSQGLHITGSGSDPLRRAIISPAQIQTEAAARLRRATMAVARTFDPAILHELQPSDNAAVSSKMVACDPAGTRMPISEVWLGAPEFYSTTVERLFPDSTDTVTVDRGIAWALNQDYTQEALAKHGIEVSQLISHVLAGKLGRKPDSSRQQICLSDLAVYLRQCIAELSGDSAKTYELSALSARHLDLPPPYGAVLRIARNQLLESYRTNLSNLRKLIDASAPTVPELRRIGAGIIDKTELQELGIKLANNFASRIGAWAKRFMPQNALLKEGGYDQMALVNYFTYVDARLRQHLTHSNRIGYKQLHAEHLHFSGANSGDYKAFSVRAAADEASRHIACLCAVAVQEGSTDSATGHRRELIEQAQLSVTRYPDEALQAQLHLSIAALRAAGMKLSPNFNDFLTGYLEARGLAAVQSLSGEVLAPISVISRLFAHASQLVEGIPKGIRSAEQAAELNQNVPVAENTPASELSKKVLEELVHLNSTVAAALSDSGAALTRSCSAPSQQVVALSALREARFYLDDTGCDRFRKWLSVFGLEDALVQVESETWLSLGMLEAYTQYCLAVQPLLSGREPDPGSLLICFSGGLNGIVGTKAAIETELKSNQATLALARELGHLPVPGPLAATSDYRTLSKPWGGAQTILQSLSAEQRKQAPLYGAEQLSGLGLFAREDFGAFIERWCRRVSLPELPSSREGARLYSLPVLQAVFEGGSRFIESELGVGRRSLATCDELPFFVYHAGERPVRELRKKEMADQIRYNLAVVGELRTALGEIEACRNEEAYPYRSMNELRTAGWMLGTAGLRRFHAWADRLQLEPGFSLDDDNPRIPLRLVETYLNFCKRWALSELVSSHADLERQLVAFPPALDATKRVNTGEVYNF